MKRQTFGTYSALEDGQWGTGFNFKLALYLLIVLCLLLPFSARKAAAQSAFGSITGTVTDPQGSVIPGAKVTVRDESTGVSQSAQTNGSGEFVFPSLLPATYTVTAEKEGFKRLGKTGLALVAAQRLSAGTFQLAVGQATITVTVNAEGEAVETSSSEISSTLSMSEVAKLPSIGLDYMALMAVLPGSSYIGWGSSSLTVGGSTSVTFNGLTGAMAGNGTYVSTNGVYSSWSESSNDSDPADIDNIEDIHVLMSNSEAEYGRTVGSVINVTTKSGTSQFHGGAYYYFRNMDLNANDYFNIRNDQPRSLYHYNNFGGTFGGPVLIPGWSESRKKLFFFFSFADAPDTYPEGPKTFYMPTAQERNGDFSQGYLPGTTYVLPIKDPVTQQPYPGNIIPPDKIDPTMQTIFNKVFPLPNFFNTAISQGYYNYVISPSDKIPADRASLRLDYAATSKIRLFSRYQRSVSEDFGPDMGGVNAGWQNGGDTYRMAYQRFEVGGTYAITPRLFNQASGGWNVEDQTLTPSSAELSQFQTTALGINFPNPTPSQNPLNLIPSMYFMFASNGTSGPTFEYNYQFPQHNMYHGWSISDDLTYVRGNHQLKAGVYVDATTINQPGTDGLWGDAGSGLIYYWSPDPTNPRDVGNPLAQALTGTYDLYQYVTTKADFIGIQRDFEWYAQDEWKVTKKLSLNYGVRFTKDFPIHSGNQYAASIDFSKYNPADASPLYRPVMVGGTRMMRNPVTGALQPSNYYDMFVQGVGNPAPGSVLLGNKYLADPRGVLVAPRFGFAYDPFADGKTVIRGGFGKSYSPRTTVGHVGLNILNPPVAFSPNVWHGSIEDLGSAAGLYGPTNGNYMDLHGKLPYSLQWSLGVQRELGYKTVAGLSYVANITRHGEYGNWPNSVPYGAEFLPQNQDPTEPGSPLADDYFRPYPGYGQFWAVWFGDNGNYNSLQATLERRFAHNLTYAMAYTWSRTLNDNKSTAYIPYSATYGPTIGQNRPNRLTTDWVWEVPKGSRYWNNWLSRFVLDNWSFSGIASFISGPSENASCSAANGENITGGGDGYQCIINGSAILPKSKRTFNQYFNTSVFSLPTPIPAGQTSWTTANVGNQWNASFYGPGVNNWDLAVMKDLPVIKERFSAQLRLDMLNAFNHPSFNGVNNSASIDPSTGQQLDNAFGNLTSDMGPRTMQISLRLKF